MNKTTISNSRPRVLVLSYFNDPNFGDRLGYHIANSLLPAEATIRHCHVKPWNVPEDADFDLMVLGIGNSLNAATVRRPELMELVQKIPRCVGVFGTQYRRQYEEAIPSDLFPQLLSELDVWYARYESDLVAWGGYCEEAVHLGDWLISAFPMNDWSLDKRAVVPASIKEKTVCMDRYIQEMQRYRHVYSYRLHPLLCALTSAETFAFKEQIEDPVFGEKSGKFNAMLRDIFGKEFAEDQYYPVDREKVVQYKTKVQANLNAMSVRVRELLA